jgi:crotonobetainyl-CoA:carnitine CoA-transferase CaiB-like acyl-CoA transferase
MSLRPLDGVRVLEVGSDMAMSFGCRLLADLGAEVIKVEPPGGGDPLRQEGPFPNGAMATESSALFGYLNAGKRSVTIDAGRPSGDALVDRLAAGSDVVVWAPRGLEAASLEQRLEGDGRDGPVLVTATSFGLKGPGAERAGTPFVVQHSSGFALHQSCPVTDPAGTPPVACADREAALTVGIVVAISALWGLEMARVAGRAPVIDLSAEDVFAYMLVEPYAEAAGGRDGFTRQRAPGSGTAVIGGLVWYLPCADGAVLVSPREDHQWTKWVQVMGEPEWSADPALCGSREARAAHAERLQELMAEWSVTRPAQEIFLAAQESRVACFPISSGEDLLANPQLAHRRYFSTLDLGGGRSVAVPGLPFLMKDSEGRTLERGRRLASPPLGEGNAEVLADRVGLDDEGAETLARYRII